MTFALLLAGFCLLVAWWVYSAVQNGRVESSPEDRAATEAIALFIAGVAALGGLWALARIPVILRHRVEIDRGGLQWRSVHVPWDRVRSVRILVLSTTQPVVTSPLPRSARTSARIYLELALREPELAEGLQPRLVKHRIPGRGQRVHPPVRARSRRALPVVEARRLRAAGPGRPRPGGAPDLPWATIRETATTWTR
ncbi:hypothetical protein NKG05_18085 [Oerskovia sp. M15]